MRFMFLVKATASSDTGDVPQEAVTAAKAALADYHAQLAQAGVLLDAAGLRPSHEGWQVHCSGGQRRVVEGAGTDTPELLAGYTLIQVPNREAALEWARRFPTPLGSLAEAQIEVRQMDEPQDLKPC